VAAKKNQILGNERISGIIKRIAFEIYENNYTAKELAFGGICKSGLALAGMIASELREISKIDVFTFMVDMDKTDPAGSEIKLQGMDQDLKGKSLVLVDDVQNTGKTLAYSLKPFLEMDVAKIETAVLVNRDHTNFPVAPTYTGYELSTTIDEHILVDLSANKMSAYLA